MSAYVRTKKLVSTKKGKDLKSSSPPSQVPSGTSQSYASIASDKRNLSAKSIQSNPADATRQSLLNVNTQVNSTYTAQGSTLEIDQRPNPSNVKETAQDDLAMTIPESTRANASVYNASDFWMGQLVKVPHVVPTTKTNGEDATSQVQINGFGYFLPKIRYAIVVARYGARMVVLPVYSNRGNGPFHKSTAYQFTAITVLNTTQINDPDWRGLETKESLYVKGNTKLSGGSHINLTEPMAVHYNTPITKWDMLDEPSISLLRRRYEMAVKLADYAPMKQVGAFERMIDDEKEKEKEKEQGSNTVTNSMAAVSLSDSPAPSQALTLEPGFKFGRRLMYTGSKK